MDYAFYKAIKAYYKNDKLFTMKKPKAILFDFDGTLVHSIDFIIELFVECFREQNIEPASKDTIRRLIGEPLTQIARKLSNLIDVEKFSESFRQKETLRHHTIQFIEETLPTLEAIKAQKIKLAIVSTKPHQMIERYLDDKKIKDLFELIIGGDDVKNPKPDPEPIFLACEKLGIETPETMLVGDSLMDCLAAKNADVIFVGVLTGTASKKDFQENGADYIFQHIGEVKKLIEN